MSQVFLPCVLWLSLSAAADTTSVQFDLLDRALIQQRLERVTRKLPDRRAALESLFREAGCTEDRLTTQRVPGSREPNILCTLPGEAPETIVVGGHFDLVDRGMGAVDDWSGAALLPSLYQSLAGKPRRHTFVFAGFAAEEVGLYGSSEYVRKLSKQEKLGVRAMVNLECLGLTPVKVWTGRADKNLAEAYMQVVTSLKMPAEGVDVGRVGDDDSHPFLSAKIPVITLHSLTQDTLGILHSQRDNLQAIHPDEYYAAYRVAATYLAYLDSVLR